MLLRSQVTLAEDEAVATATGAERMSSRSTQQQHWIRSRAFRMALVTCLYPFASLLQATETLERISLDQALAIAFERSPSLRAMEARVEEARGDLTQAGVYPYNPEFGGAAGRRSSSAGPSSTDSGVQLSQEIEIAGQRQRRRAAAASVLEETDNLLQRERRILAARVRVAFVAALRARELFAIEETNRELTRSLLDFTERRLDAGKGTQMETNLARIDFGRASLQTALAGAVYKATRSFLAEVIALDPENPPEPVGHLIAPGGPPGSRQELVRAARERRGDLLAARQAIETAQRRIDLAKREVRPNLRVGAFYDREEGTDTIVGASLSIGLPFFNRNQGVIQREQASLSRASQESIGVGLRVEQEVTAAFAQLEAAREAAAALEELVFGTLQENLQLLQVAFEAGKIGWTDVLVFRRTFIDGQRDYVETMAKAWEAKISLDLASGEMNP